jgi:hypothetical protein
MDQLSISIIIRSSGSENVVDYVEHRRSHFSTETHVLRE